MVVPSMLPAIVQTACEYVATGPGHASNQRRFTDANDTVFRSRRNLSDFKSHSATVRPASCMWQAALNSTHKLLNKN